MANATYYRTIVAGSAIGMLASFLQTLEKLTLIKDAGSSLYCNINSVFSCSNVLNSPQASLFGFPNSIMCLVLFTVFLSIGLAGVSSAGLARRLRLGVQLLSLFTLGFGLWFIWQSIYVIAAVCIFCLFCITGLLAVNWAWLRINSTDYSFLGARTSSRLSRWTAAGYDSYIWAAIGLAIILAIVGKFYL